MAINGYELSSLSKKIGSRTIYSRGMNIGFVSNSKVIEYENRHQKKAEQYNDRNVGSRTNKNTHAGPNSKCYINCNFASQKKLYLISSKTPHMENFIKPQKFEKFHQADNQDRNRSLQPVRQLDELLLLSYKVV